MAERILNKLKEIWEKIVEWWNGFTGRQKTYIVLLSSAVVVAFVILYAVLSAPKFVLLEQCDSTKEASEIITVLDDNNIQHKVSDDGLRISVPRNDVSTARVSLGASGITVKGYSIEDALQGSLTVTEADKQKKYKLYLEEKLENDLTQGIAGIKSAGVTISIPENDGTLLSKNEEASAALTLNITDDFTNEQAANVARFVANALGKKTTEDIVILDTDANLLFSGDDSSTVYGTASSQLGVKKEAEDLVNSSVKKILQGTGEFGDIKVSSSLVIDFSTTQKTTHNYTPAEGQAQGVLSEESSYNSESSGGTSGVPGTDSNSETSYQYNTNDYSSETIEELYRKYLPNEYIEYQDIPAGVIDYRASSLAVSSTNYVVINEDDAKKQGLLDGITWEEYQAANSERRVVPVSAELISAASDASGIPEDNITIVAYEENFFVDSEGLNIDIYDLIQVILIVIILGLLAVVVLRSMRTEKPEEETEELSVETLLQSNPEPQLDDIELEENSETKKLIEKFVDENPEAVANLLRNWLSEEWG